MATEKKENTKKPETTLAEDLKNIKDLQEQGLNIIPAIETEFYLEKAYEGTLDGGLGECIGKEIFPYRSAEINAVILKLHAKGHKKVGIMDGKGNICTYNILKDQPEKGTISICPSWEHKNKTTFKRTNGFGATRILDGRNRKVWKKGGLKKNQKVA